MRQGSAKYGRDNIGVFRYGSLLTDPGPNIAPHVIAPSSAAKPVED